jgi:hypothetical protein
MNTHPGKLRIVVASIQQKLKCLAIPKNSCPRQRSESTKGWVGISHVRSLYESLDEKQVVIFRFVRELTVGADENIPLTALLRRTLASFSAMIGGVEWDNGV